MAGIRFVAFLACSGGVAVEAEEARRGRTREECENCVGVLLSRKVFGAGDLENTVAALFIRWLRDGHVPYSPESLLDVFFSLSRIRRDARHLSAGDK